MAKDRKIKESKEEKTNESVVIPNSLSKIKYKPLPKFKGCTNC